MNTATVSEKLKTLAKDLTKDYPRSPRETLAGYVTAARILDKCRAHLNGTNGEYTFGTGLDTYFWDFTGISADDFAAFVAEGASDEAVAQWIQQRSKVTERVDMIKWNNQLRYTKISELSDSIQLSFEEYIEKYVPKHRPVYFPFDIYDLEEGRL